LLKNRLSKFELVFVLFTALALFAVTVHLMSLDGILPGNDPAVHIAKAETIIANKGVAYSDIPWYPPLFHAFLAILLLLAGAVDIAVASLLVKLMVAAITVLILLSTYVFSRRFLGVGVAVCSAIFTFMSVAFFEMVFWGGYTSYLGLAYIPFILYIAYANFSGPVKTSLLIAMSFALVLTHQLSAFVFFLIFVPSFFVSSVKSRGRLMVFLAIIVGGGLGILAWYGDMILRYSDIMFAHLFFGAKEYLYNIPSANLESFIKIFGFTLILGIIGIPLAFASMKKRKLLSVYLLLVLWLAVPFIMSQSYLFGIYILYGRFIPYLATPIAILAGVSAYSLTKLPSRLATKFQNAKNRVKLRNRTQILVFALLLSLFLSQSALSLEQINSFPWYYDVSGLSGVKTSEWLQHNSLPKGVVIVSEKPGSWLHLITDYMTVEETDPLYGRNAEAEAVEYLFFEVETNSTLTREYLLNGPLSGQVFYSSVHNVWEKVFSISDSTVYVAYMDNMGSNDVISLSEIPKTTYWTQKKVDSVQMTSEYSHALFSVTKQVTISQFSSSINLDWTFTAKMDLADAKIRIYSQTDPTLSFQEALIPGLLQWQNPWDNPSRVDPQQSWAVVECPPDNLTDDIVALRDSKNGKLAIFQFGALPDWFNVGALENRAIDAVRVGYEFGALAKNESKQVSFSFATASFEPSSFEWETTESLKRFMNAQTNQKIQARDFLTYIDDYNIEFVVVSAQQLPVDLGWTRSRKLIYYDGKLAVYAIKH
jgi:hypothetical protein